MTQVTRELIELAAHKEAVARIIIGPRDQLPAGSKYTLEELQTIRWQQASDAERRDALWASEAILSALSAAWRARSAATL